MKRCAKCGEVKPTDEFFPEKRNRDGLASRCRPCHRERLREHRAACREEERMERAIFATANDQEGT